MRGFGSVIGIVIAMALTAILVLLYLRISVPSAPDVKGQIGAIDRARGAASAVEEQQKRYTDDLNKQLEQ